jgi:hypothetical protein
LKLTIPNINSAYDEIRRKSGPKRGYVKALEARLGKSVDLRQDRYRPSIDPNSPHHLLIAPSRNNSYCAYANNAPAQVETLLREKSSQSPERNLGRLPFPSSQVDPLLFGGPGDDPLDPMLVGRDSPGTFNGSPMLDLPANGMFTPHSMAWEMISMGIEEALPDPEVVDAL